MVEQGDFNMSTILFLILAALFLAALYMASVAVSCVVFIFKAGLVALVAFGAWKAVKLLFR